MAKNAIFTAGEKPQKENRSRDNRRIEQKNTAATVSEVPKCDLLFIFSVSEKALAVKQVKALHMSDSQKLIIMKVPLSPSAIKIHTEEANVITKESSAYTVIDLLFSILPLSPSRMRQIRNTAVIKRRASNISK